ncbi:hypothetical protein BKA59DRAFT_508610 [Fusarium tricinctum]|uniref:Uncharacterized protein n=1 Tax=Fusarium tricinctum TaxID=61284 RepID=A0A8K0S9C9_9HYPO|nr:hypothetical protein BKA59DRAFT_508610 [Fusarium tricinctum]
MSTGRRRLIAKTRPSRASSMSTDSYLDCKPQKPKSEALTANINEDHPSSRTVSYANVLKGPQSPKAESLAGDIDNEPQSPKTASLSGDANDEPQSPQPPERPANSTSFRLLNNQSSKRHDNPWIGTLQYRVSALVNSIEIAQANALPFGNHANLREPLPFVMDPKVAALLVRSNMYLVAEWIIELQMKGASQFDGLEDIVEYLRFFGEHWSVGNHLPLLLQMIQRLMSHLVG